MTVIVWFSQDEHRHEWRFYLFYFILLLLLQSTTPNPLALDYPCKPPYHSHYPFCNTSLSIPARATILTSLLTLSEKISLLSDNASSVPTLGIPRYEWWSESLHGLATNGPGVTFNGVVNSATSFPQVIVSAASFNRTLWSLIAAAVAVEARAMYNVGQAGLTFWAPNINIFRDPRWGGGRRLQGRIPWWLLLMELSDGGDDDDARLMVSACCKHFTAYDLDMWHQFSRYNFNAVVSKQDLEDTYQPPFRGCIQKGKASCLMCSYNAVNGVPACADADLLGLARYKWGFKGYITSDCDAVATVFEYQKYVKSEEDAVADVLKAGVDINCGTYMLRHTESAVEQGKVKEEDIDRALFNLFLRGPFGKLGPQDVCTPQHLTLALEAARQGIVLLKNDKKFLPLDQNNDASLAVIGPMAVSDKLGGGYSGIPCSSKSLYDGLGEFSKRISYAPGCHNVSCNSDDGFAEALETAKKADFVVIFAGLDMAQETEDHDRVSLILPGRQMDLVSTIAAVSKSPVILVLTGGGPLDVSFAERNQQIGSILWVGYPGEAGGKALAEIIFGVVNPAGRLPVTWYPESFTNVPMTDMSMRADPSRGYPGRTYRFYTGSRVYGFGHGLSYSDYSYKFLSAPSKLSLSKTIKHNSRKSLLSQLMKADYKVDYVRVDELQSCSSLSFSVHISVTNLGELDGSHVVLLFSRGPKVFEGSPEAQLVGFSRVHTTTYESTETSVLVDPCEHLSFADEQGKKILPLGNHILSLGMLSTLFQLKCIELLMTCQLCKFIDDMSHKYKCLSML
ncbi:putative beta-D-xylosidase [Arachis hypogaea]|nr:putative beta-D-xylosidase [Arachis hypogaea]